MQIIIVFLHDLEEVTRGEFETEQMAVPALLVSAVDITEVSELELIATPTTVEIALEGNFTKQTKER